MMNHNQTQGQIISSKEDVILEEETFVLTNQVSFLGKEVVFIE